MRVSTCGAGWCAGVGLSREVSESTGAHTNVTQHFSLTVTQKMTSLVEGTSRLLGVSGFWDAAYDPPMPATSGTGAAASGVAALVGLRPARARFTAPLGATKFTRSSSFGCLCG